MRLDMRLSAVDLICTLLPIVCDSWHWRFAELILACDSTVPIIVIYNMYIDVYSVCWRFGYTSMEHSGAGEPKESGHGFSGETAGEMLCWARGVPANPAGEICITFSQGKWWALTVWAILEMVLRIRSRHHPQAVDYVILCYTICIFIIRNML